MARNGVWSCNHASGLMRIPQADGSAAAKFWRYATTSGLLDIQQRERVLYLDIQTLTSLKVRFHPCNLRNNGIFSIP